MAKRGSGLKAIVRVAKAIDQANKKNARNNAKLQKFHEKELIKKQKVQEKEERQRERELIAKKKADQKLLEQIKRQEIALIKASEKRKKQKFKEKGMAEKLAAQQAFEKRCSLFGATWQSCVGNGLV